MATKEITDLTNAATYDGDYYVPVDDPSFAEAKKMKLSVLVGDEATTREANDDAIIAGVGLESDGSFDAIATSNYLTAAAFASEALSETVKNALTLLDSKVKEIEDDVAGYGDLTELTVTVPEENLKNLNAVQYEVVPAPGDGYIIDPISVVAFLDYSGGAIEVGTNDLLLRTESGDTVATFTNAFYEGAADKIEKAEIEPNSTLRENEALELYCAADDSGGTSTSTMKIYITYRIITK